MSSNAATTGGLIEALAGHVRELSAKIGERSVLRGDGLEFLGSFYRATLQAARLGDLEIIADFSINDVHDLTLDEGATLQIALPGEHIRIFAED